METIGLIISCLLTLVLIVYLSSIKKKNQIQKVFIIDSILAFSWCALLLAQKYFCANYDINPIIFDYFIYICICFLPVSILFTGIIFANTRIKFSWKYTLLFIIPIISLLMLWTNNFHHLFYVNYSTDMDQTIFGSYWYIHSIYTLILYFFGLSYLLKYSIKNSGIFSKQAILIIIAVLPPIIVNVLGISNIVSMSIYLTPMCFTFTILLCYIAIFKFKLLSVAPIALQKIVDRISDSYIVLDEDNVITDFNRTFLSTFNLDASNVRNMNLFDLIKESKVSVVNEEVLKDSLIEAQNSSNKYFHIEINTITSKGDFLGTLILLKDTTQHMQDIQTIQNKQDMLMEKERLASLGQLIGGISHNLKTPIMSISGAAEGLTDLINEYDASIGDPEVTPEDHHAIANDMREWISKIHSYTAYMSDIITAVKGQAVALSENENDEFTIDELVKRVNILMKHEIRNASLTLETNIEAPSTTTLHGDVNSLVQVVNNLITNAIQSYNGKTNESITLTLKQDDNNLIISVADQGCGMPADVQEKLFKTMITTKGKNGTGLGMFMSYSTIKGHFKGDITFTSEVGKGTTFNIIIPLLNS